MFAFIFFGVIVIQILLNKLTDEKRILNGRVFVLTAVIFLYLFVFPVIFTRTLPEVDGVRCGLPVLAFVLSFWIGGTLISIITHVIYYFVNGKQKIYPDD